MASIPLSPLLWLMRFTPAGAPSPNHRGLLWDTHEQTTSALEKMSEHTYTGEETDAAEAGAFDLKDPQTAEEFQQVHLLEEEWTLGCQLAKFCRSLHKDQIKCVP